MSPQQVSVKRTELAAPDLADPTRVMVQIQYQVGELPPRFLYLAKKDWTAQKEKDLISADIAKRLQAPGEIISV